MRYIHVTGPVPARKNTALQNRIAAVAAKTTVAEKKVYIKKTNTWGLLKNWLSDFSHGKCWYCEAKTERATNDVDHFRPKAGVTVGRVAITHDGYYWLAYDWSNFRLSCQRCNRPEKDEMKVLRGKANEFALVDEANRCINQTSELTEQPKLLDPCNKDDPKLLAHLVDGTVLPACEEGTVEYERAEYTKDVLGFNSFGVPHKKREGWEPLKLLIEIAGDTDEVKQHLHQRLSSRAEYSQFYRAAISTYKDKDWVAAIL